MLKWKIPHSCRLQNFPDYSNGYTPSLVLGNMVSIIGSGVGFGMEDQPTTPRKSQSILAFIDEKLRRDLGCRNFLLRTETSFTP
jgi:hypothetical protein